MKNIPKQLYVVASHRQEYEYIKVNGDYDFANPIITEYNLGFLHPHEPTRATDAKRKKTQHQWAYCPSYKDVIYQVGGVWWQKGSRYKQDGTHGIEDFDEPIPLEVAPRIWDNEPLTGFKIIDTANRYRGNKLLIIQDPRGLRFEITVASLFEIISNGTIVNGEIMNPCVWKSGKNLVIYE